MTKHTTTVAGAALGLILGAGAVAVPGSATASPAGDGLVISEVYGGGGNSGSTWTHDFIELTNPTDRPIDLAGMSVQYRSSTGTGPGQVTPLTGQVPAGGSYLIQQAKGTGGSTPLPSPDATGTIAMGGSGGQVWLVRGTAPTTPPTGDLAGNDTVVDFVGGNTAATSYETGPVTANPSASTSLQRSGLGVDSDSNAADFRVAEPTPQGTGGSGPDPEPDPEPSEVAIADVQGTGATSPMVGKQVITSGVVTATYPTGGLDGYTLQTAGTGGSAPTEASPAIFVYSASQAAQVTVGDHVRVRGEVKEFNGLTEIVGAGLTPLSEPASVTPLQTGWPRTEAERERLESMLIAPQGPFTVTDNYSLNNYAEIGLAAGDKPLVQPTELADAQDTAAIARITEDNAARKVALDDGASINFLGADANKDIALPWLTGDPTIRVGEKATFAKPVVVDYRNNAWKWQPTGRLTAADEAGVLPATFSDTRTAAPEPVGGGIQVASFNVLNYFTDLGVDVPGCTFYTDRDGDPVTVNGGCDVRGAAEQEDFTRQQAKIVRAINGLGAEVVSLEEIENNAAVDPQASRDEAIANLVEALNAQAGAGTWAYVPSPSSAGDQSDEDVIRTGFIYKPAAVKPVGESRIHDVPAFDIARDPLAQVFAPVDGTVQDRFILIVNHFKSKGSGPDDGTGQGNSNPQRVEQARELVRFADQVKADTGVPKVYLDGDFNSYTQEDPMQVLYEAGYTELEQKFGGQNYTYTFGGMVGSLDHGLANDAALATTTGSTVWPINSVESVALEYGRFNYNLTDFFDGSTPYRSSDHDPVIFGVRTSTTTPPPPPPAAPKTTLRTTVSPRPLIVKRTRARVVTRVRSNGAAVRTGRIEVRVGGRVRGAARVVDGVARVRLTRFGTVGRKRLTVVYVPGKARAARQYASVRVVRRR